MCGAYTNHAIHLYSKTYLVELIYPFAAGFILEKAYLVRIRRIQEYFICVQDVVCSSFSVIIRPFIYLNSRPFNLDLVLI